MLLASSLDIPALPDFPQNVQVAAHIKEFLKDGYRCDAEAIVVKFPLADGTRAVNEGTVGVTDGFTKLLIMAGICLITHHLETWLCIGVLLEVF